MIKNKRRKPGSTSMNNLVNVNTNGCDDKNTCQEKCWAYTESSVPGWWRPGLRGFVSSMDLRWLSLSPTDLWRLFWIVLQCLSFPPINIIVLYVLWFVLPPCFKVFDLTGFLVPTSLKLLTFPALWTMLFFIFWCANHVFCGLVLWASAMSDKRGLSCHPATCSMCFWTAVTVISSVPRLWSALRSI